MRMYYLFECESHLARLSLLANTYNAVLTSMCLDLHSVYHTRCGRIALSSLILLGRYSVFVGSSMVSISTVQLFSSGA